MGILDSFGMLASTVVAAIVMLIFAILSLFVMVFIVDAAASIADLDPSDGFTLLSAAIIAAAAIVAGGGVAAPEME
ncbi:hypothetical protein [Halovenus marina]|jgi:hypothetical protein|uniref:hypothetical protein n=1 Tax=Halovenus marina TaxID=3396621 RepID=UPI003F5761F7